MSKSGKRDRGRHQSRKKAAHTLKEKRAMKREKHDPHPEDMVAKLGHEARMATQHHVHH